MNPEDTQPDTQGTEQAQPDAGAGQQLEPSQVTQDAGENAAALAAAVSPTADQAQPTTDATEDAGPMMPVRSHIKDRITWNRRELEIQRELDDQRRWREEHEPMLQAFIEQVPNWERTVKEHEQYKSQLDAERARLNWLKAKAKEANVDVDDPAFEAAVAQQRLHDLLSNVDQRIETAVTRVVSRAQQEQARRVSEWQVQQARQSAEQQRAAAFEAAWKPHLQSTPELEAFEPLVRQAYDANAGKFPVKDLVERMFAGTGLLPTAKNEARLKAKAELADALPSTIRGQVAKQITSGEQKTAKGLTIDEAVALYKKQQSGRG